MKSSKSTLWILITTIIIINLCQVNQAIKPGLKDNSTLSKKIIKRRLSQDQLFEDLNDDSGSDGTSFYFLPAKTIRGNTRYGYMQDSVDSNGGDISYSESDEEIKSSSARLASILPNGRPGRMRVRRVESSLLPSADHLIESNSEYKFDDLIVPNSSSSAKRNYNSSSASLLLASPSSSSLASSLSPNQSNHGLRSTSFGSRRRIKIKEIQSDPNREPGNDPISHFMEVDMKENEEGKELLDPGSSEIRDTIEPIRGSHFNQNFRNSDPLDSVNSGLSHSSFSRFKSNPNTDDSEGTLPRPQSSSLSETNANNGASNPQYRPNYEHYESRGGSPSRTRETIGMEGGFTGIVAGSSQSSSSSRQLHPSLIRSTENSDPVRGIRSRYFRPQTVGDYRQSNHAYINANRPPTILIPNQDIRQQLPRPYYVTTLPPILTSSLPYTTYSDLSMVGLSHYQSGNSEFDSRPQSHRSSQTGRRPSSHYRTMIADHLVDEDEPSGYNGRGLTTVSPLPSQPTSRPTRGTTSTTSTTHPSTELTRTRPVSRDYNYNYDVDRQRQPNYDYHDQPTTRFNNPNSRLNNRNSNDRSHRNQFYSQATATTTTSTTTTTTTPRPSHRYQYNNNEENNFDRTNDRGQPQNYRSDYNSPGQTGTVAPTIESEQPNQSDPGPRPFRIRPAGRPGGGRRRRKRPRIPLSSNQAVGPTSRPSTTTTTTTTTTTPPPYYYDDYDDNDDYEYDYQTTTTTTTHRPRRKGRRGQGGRRGQRTSTTPSTTTTTTTTTPAPTTRTLSPGYKHRPDNRIIDYMVDPNFPHELKGADLTDYPFYISLPTEINFNCEGRHDGYYASIEHKCQVYHHCALGHRYDFLCPNYTLFDQTTFTCRFINTVDCLKSENHFNRNDELYVETTEKPENGGKSSKNEKERSKRDDKEAIKAEASSINKQISSDLNNNLNNSSDSNSFKKEIIAKLELNGEINNNSDNLNNKTKVRNKETDKDESYKT